MKEVDNISFVLEKIVEQKEITTDVVKKEE